MRQYARVLSTVLSGLESRSVIDFGAGTGWIRRYGFGSYLALDFAPPDEPWARKWDFDHPLPEEYRRKYDVGISLNAIQHAVNPNQTLNYFLGALRSGGILILAAPWLYPPADRTIDIATSGSGRSLALTHNLGGYPGEMVSFVSILGR